jgi:small subunit ribosomal protein S17
MAEDQTPQTEQQTADAPETEAGAQAPESGSGAGAPQASTEPQEVLAPKERRRRARTAKAAREQARPSRSPEERHTERAELRRRKAEVRRAGRARAKAKAPATRSEGIAAREHVAGVQKVRQGIVVSDKADKTITVRIDTARRHRRYSKIVRTSRTVHAHDEANDANLGDTVVVREARPLSRTKRWRLIEVLERAE